MRILFITLTFLLTVSSFAADITSPHSENHSSANTSMSPLLMENGIVAGSWLVPNGFACASANQCLSNICLQGGPQKICDSEGITCNGQGSLCLNDCDCCSNSCASNGRCVADGVFECVPNGTHFRSSGRECCSGRGDSRGVCRPSQLRCINIAESCQSNQECCSQKCNSRGVCAPSSNMLRRRNLLLTTPETPQEMHK